LLVLTLCELGILPLCSFFKGDKGIAGQVTALLKYEYPSIIKEKNKDGVETKRHAFEWEDYCIVDPPNEETGEISESAADQFKHEFWVRCRCTTCFIVHMKYNLCHI
jgi:hypothetical protein